MLPWHQKWYLREAARAPDAAGGPGASRKGLVGRPLRAEGRGDGPGSRSTRASLEAWRPGGLVAMTLENTLERPWEGTRRRLNNSSAFILYKVSERDYWALIEAQPVQGDIPGLCHSPSPASADPRQGLHLRMPLHPRGAAPLLWRSPEFWKRRGWGPRGLPPSQLRKVTVARGPRRGPRARRCGAGLWLLRSLEDEGFTESEKLKRRRVVLQKPRYDELLSHSNEIKPASKN